MDLERGVAEVPTRLRNLGELVNLHDRKFIKNRDINNPLSPLKNPKSTTAKNSTMYIHIVNRYNM